MDKLKRLKNHLTDAIKNLTLAVGLIGQEENKSNAIPRVASIDWNGEYKPKKTGYKISAHRKVTTKPEQRMVWGAKNDPMAKERLMVYTIKFIKDNNIPNRGVLKTKNNKLYMALWHRNMLDEIPNRL